MKYIYLNSLMVLFVACTGRTERSQSQEIFDLTELKSMADSCYEIDQYEKAIKYYNLLIELDSTVGEFYFKRAYSKDQLFLSDSSGQDYLRAIALGYRLADSYYNLGLSEILLGNDSLAIIYFNKSLEIDPDNHKVLEVLNSIKYGKGDI